MKRLRIPTRDFSLSDIDIVRTHTRYLHRLIEYQMTRRESVSKESRRKQLAPFSVLVNQVVDDLSVPQRVKRSLTS